MVFVTNSLISSVLTKHDTRVDINNMVYVDGAQEVEVETSDEALALFCKGRRVQLLL